jgi:hypothetical protein
VSVAGDHAKIDRLQAALLAAYGAAEERIEAELQEIVDLPSQFRKRTRLRLLATEVQRLKSDLDGQLEDWIADELHQVYELGGEAGASELGVTFSFTQVHEAAVEQVAGATYKDLLRSTKHMTSDAKRLVRASAKEATLMKLLTGQTARQAARGFEGELKKNSIAAIIYKDGSRHGVKEYADVVLRSTTAVAYNKGHLVEAKENDARYAIIHDGPECCLYSHFEGPRANNLIVAIGTALQYPISHPRCRRSVSALLEIRSKKQAQAAMGEGTYATTAAQDAAQKTADALTRGQQRLAANKRARENRLAARASKLASA